MSTFALRSACNEVALARHGRGARTRGRGNVVPQQARDIQNDTSETRRMMLQTLGGVTEIKTNHLAHLQDGIEKVAQSNVEAVEVLRDIKTGIAVLTDRFPRT